jgi:predicted pyridoxine 5'-phosphate oxidase superfamily flavin-nucleotide-binding protein
MDTATWHEGEIALQQRTGWAARLAEVGPRVIRDHMPQQHRDFFAQLPFLIAGTLDAQGQPWASVLAAAPGFATSPDERKLAVRATPLAHDPLAGTLRDGAPIGLLGIEPHTRRRNRMNGTVRNLGPAGFDVDVLQSFGNCPKYIQAREPSFDASVPTAAAVHQSAGLGEAAARLVERADTFFIATAHPQAGASRAFGVDVSHRGGKPGFVRVRGNELLVPDFAGNAFFNTLGNLAVNPRCGLLFMDFETGERLYLAARGEIVFEGPELAAFEGAQRLMRLQVHEVRSVEGGLPLRWSPAELSPFLAPTGAWV